MKLKGAWNGTQNNMYWAGLKFFEDLAETTKIAKKAEKALPEEDKQRKVSQQDARKAKLANLVARVDQTTLPSADNSCCGMEFAIHEDCDDVRKRSLEFIGEYGLNQKEWRHLMGDIGANSWGAFLKFSGVSAGAANISYVRAYEFLEVSVENY